MSDVAPADSEMRTEPPETGYAMSGQVEIRPVAATMQLTGTLRRRRDDFYLEELFGRNTGDESGWTVPRIYRLLETSATQVEAEALIDHLVSVTGSPNYSVALQRTVVVLESIEPAIVESAPDLGFQDVDDHGIVSSLTL